MISRVGALRRSHQLDLVAIATFVRVSLGVRSLARLRMIVMRVGLTGADQCVASLSNFAVGVAIARVAGVEALGAYSLAYIVWLCMAGLHRALVAEPMAIDNDLRGKATNENVRIGLAGELALGAGMGCVVGFIGCLLLLIGQRAYGVAFVALTPWVPCLLVQDYWRWVAFMKAAPGKALANDLLFDGVQALAFLLLFVLGLHSSVLAISTWGMGALAGSLFGLWQHSITPTVRGGIARMRERWTVSRGLLGLSITNWGSSQLYVILTGAMLGPAGIGGLRAAQSLVSGPTFVFLQAGGMIGLPEASKALHDRGWKGMRTVGRAVTGAGVLSIGVVGLVVLLFGRRLLILLYGSQFGRFAPTADILVLSVLVATTSLGAILALKSTKLTGLLFGSSLVSLVVSAVAVVVMVPMFGLNGAAGAAVARNSTSSTMQLLLQRRYVRRAADALLAGRKARAERDLVPAVAPNGATPERRDGRDGFDGPGEATGCEPSSAVACDRGRPVPEVAAAALPGRLGPPKDKDPAVQWWQA